MQAPLEDEQISCGDGRTRGKREVERRISATNPVAIGEIGMAQGRRD